LSARKARKIPHSFFKRAGSSFALIVAVVLVGMLGIHQLEGYSFVDSFYFIAMLATGEGPAAAPVTEGGKIFAGLMAFVSVGAVLTALFFLLGPFLGSVLRLGLERIEEEAEKEKEKIEKRS
jgi:hypothetical protein